MNYRSISTLGILSGLLLVGGASQEGYAQYRQNPQFMPYSSVGFGAGTSTYFGDLAGYRQPLRTLTNLPRWNVGLMYSRQFTPRFGARASFTYARIVGDDFTYTRNDVANYAALFTRNLHFRNDLKEFALIGTFDFVPSGRTPRDRPKFTPYIGLGVALLAHNPQALTSLTSVNGETPNKDQQQWVSLQPLGTEGQGQPNYKQPYSLITVSIPMVLGAKYKLNESFTLAAEVRVTPTFSDYLDDVGGPYPTDPGVFAGNPQGAEFSNRGFDVNNGQATTRERYSAYGGQDRQPYINQLTGTGANLAAPGYNQRGGGSTNLTFLRDSYLLTSFQIHYIIPAKIKCPPIR